MSHLEATLPQAASSSDCLMSPVTQHVWMGSTQRIFKILIFMVCLGSLGKKALFFGRKDCYGFPSCGSESEFLALQLPDEFLALHLPAIFIRLARLKMRSRSIITVASAVLLGMGVLSFAAWRSDWEDGYLCDKILSYQDQWWLPHVIIPKSELSKGTLGFQLQK